jgi:hypothetical protein
MVKHVCFRNAEFLRSFFFPTFFIDKKVGKKSSQKNCPPTSQKTTGFTRLGTAGALNLCFLAHRYSAPIFGWPTHTALDVCLRRIFNFIELTK